MGETAAARRALPFMTRPGTLVQLAAAGIFVIVGLRHVVLSRQSYILDPTQAYGPLLPPPPQVDVTASMIPQLYLDPANFLMWALLGTVWLMVLLDAIGQLVNPSAEGPGHPHLRRVWPALSVGLACAAIAPCVLDRLSLLTTVAALGAGAAVIAARGAAGQHRPAVGFFAGWATAVFSATVAGLAAERLSLPVQALAALAIIPGAVIGMAAQVWIGSSVGYSAALIWAFCGLAVTTMGSDPIIALAAVLGISGMATVLVRAAS